MNRTADDTLFERAPPIGVQRWLGLIKGDDPNINRPALLVALVHAIRFVPVALLAFPLSVIWAQIKSVLF